MEKQRGSSWIYVDLQICMDEICLATYREVIATASICCYKRMLHSTPAPLIVLKKKNQKKNQTPTLSQSKMP